MNDVVNVGIIGAGAISDTYLRNLINDFDGLNVVSICARHLSSAEKKALKYGIKACTYEEMLSDDRIDLVVVLTPVDTHYSIIKDFLLAGKHVYTEKTICERVDQADELILIAKEKGLYLGSAPDTFMGPCFQTAKTAIENGMIGEVTSFNISINRCNDILTAVFPFLRLPGAGVLRDYLVYYVSALVYLFGPAKRTCAIVKTLRSNRINKVPGTNGFEEEISTPNESFVSAILEFENGVTGTIHENHESMMYDRAEFAIYGSKGILQLGNPNRFDDPVYLLKADDEKEIMKTAVEPVSRYEFNERGLGASEMMKAFFEKRAAIADASVARHVLDILESMERSNESGSFVDIRSSL